MQPWTSNGLFIQGIYDALLEIVPLSWGNITRILFFFKKNRLLQLPVTQLKKYANNV